MKKELTDTSLNFYCEHGINEWHEKCQILAPEEKMQIELDLANGKSSELLALVRTPFPFFVTRYFARFPHVKSYFHDPTFAYKLYLLDDSTMRFFAVTARCPEIRDIDLRREKHFNKPNEYRERIADLCYRRFEDIPYMNSVASKSKRQLIKYAYLTQYIDLQEAQRLNLSVAPTFAYYGCDGYELKTKLSFLNPAVRKIIELYLGLSNDERHTMKQIAEELGLYLTQVSSILSILFPIITKPLPVFKSHLGIDKNLEADGNMFFYGNTSFQALDFELELAYIFHQLPAPQREFLLTTLDPKTLKEYLTAKYMYNTPIAFARAFNINADEAAEKILRLK